MWRKKFVKLVDALPRSDEGRWFRKIDFQTVSGRSRSALQRDRVRFMASITR